MFRLCAIMSFVLFAVLASAALLAAMPPDDRAVAATIGSVAFSLLLVTFCVILPGVMRWWRVNRFPRGHCRSCGYNLAGNASGRCPECGTAAQGEARL